MLKPIASPGPQAKAHYGIDAFLNIRKFALAGAAFALMSRLMALFRARTGITRLARLGLGLAAATNFGLAASMLAYALRGKLRFRDRMLDMIDWRGDEHVLDIGTGRGLLVIGAAKRLTTGTAIGIDIGNPVDLSANTLAKAQRNVAAEGVESKINVRSEDVCRLSFADNSFDVILSTLCLHTIRGNAERRTACREIARVLKPGGTALIADYTATARYLQMLAAAGLIVERSRPYLRDSFTYLRVVAATKAV